MQQTQNYVYYIHFLVLKESEQKCAHARAFSEKCDFLDSKSMLTSLIALENLPDTQQICA